MTRYFTIKQAIKTLKVVKPIVAEMLSIRQDILDHQPEVWPVVQNAAGNGGSQIASQMTFKFSRLDALVHQIQDMGVLVKDINIGLLDFPSKRNGREIYLCWKYGEENIEFWHDVDAGYAGRQPL